ncbi:MAG: NUDIX hydrolase [Pseudomonadota bacterium]
MSSPDPLAGNLPIASALAVVVRSEKVLLVRRQNPPDRGKWGFPGGKLNGAESSRAAATRELFEETGVIARPAIALKTLHLTHHPNDPDMTVQYTMTPVLCEWIEGEPIAGDDALEAGWFCVQDVLQGRLAQSKNVDTTLRNAIDYASDDNGDPIWTS